MKIRQSAPDWGRIFNLDNLCLILGVTTLPALAIQPSFEVDTGSSCHSLDTSFFIIIIIFLENKEREEVWEGEGKKEEKEREREKRCYFRRIFKSCFSARI